MLLSSNIELPCHSSTNSRATGLRRSNTIHAALRMGFWRKSVLTSMLRKHVGWVQRLIVPLL